MKLLFLGGLFAADKKSYFFSRSKASFENAANVLQWEIVNGLSVELERSIPIVSVPFLGDYPRDYSDLFVRAFSFHHGVDGEGVSVGFFNLKVFNFFSKYWSCRKTLLNVSRNLAGRSEGQFVIVYGMHAYLLLAAAYLKKRTPGARICLIVPDLPEMMGGDNSRWVIKAFHLVNNYFLSRGLNFVDCFVLLSKYMVERLPIEGRRWCVVEGIAGKRELEEVVREPGVFSILYSGTLAKRYGVLELLDAFSKVKGSRFRLWICGAGDGEGDVKRAAEKDSRITFFGQISRDDVLLMQQKANLLINPRTSSGDYTKYSFPSKIMEYFSSGTPSVLNRLEGIPEEYFDYCIVPETENAQGLYDAILRAETMGKDALHELGQAARSFILNNKNARSQCRKVLDLMQGFNYFQAKNGQEDIVGKS